VELSWSAALSAEEGRELAAQLFEETFGYQPLADSTRVYLYAEVDAEATERRVRGTLGVPVCQSRCRIGHSLPMPPAKTVCCAWCRPRLARLWMSWT